MAKLTKDETSKIAEILSPLDKDPIRNETLNPMSRVLRKIKGLPELIPDKDDFRDETPIDSGPVDGGIEISPDSLPTSDITPPQMKYFDENDIDIDELLNDAPDLIAGQTIPSRKETSQDISKSDALDEADSFGTEDPFGSDQPVNEDPFGSSTSEDSDPFGDSINTEDSSVNDPFGFEADDSVGTTTTEAETDPFSNLGTEEDSPFENASETQDSDPFDGFDEDSSSVGTTTEENDPFADAGNAFTKSTTPSAMDTDPFADIVPSNLASDEDPFADMESGSTKSEDSTAGFGEDDPFGELGDDLGTAQTSNSDDPFSAIGGKSELDDNDPFSSLGDTSSSTEDDPFGGLDDDLGTTQTSSSNDPFSSMGTGDSESFGDSDDIAGFDDSASTDSFDNFGDQNTGDISSFDSSGVDDDPFADLQQSTALGHDFDSVSDDYGSSFDDLGSNGDTSSSLGAIDEVGGGTESSYDSLDEDLDSLAQEEEAAAEEDLSDEDLAVIQQEILKYPPKLKRTVIDVITNDKLPKHEQRELVELIKASQKPEDIAAYLTEKLGYEVELYDKSGAYSERGIPVIATKEIYTKEGELRRRELIKRTALVAAAAILLVTGLISTYKYVIRPFQAARHYKEGIEYIKKAGSVKESSEKTKALLDAKASFAKGESIEPNSLEYLNKTGIAYGKIGEYEQAFEKLFGRVEPDFGLENNGKMEKWTERTEVPYIELSSKTPWNNDRLPLGGRVVPESEYMVLISGSGKKKVERKIKVAGAYIVARLEKNIHDNPTYINLGKFHSNIANLFTKGSPPNLNVENKSSNVNPFGERTLGVTSKYKNDNLAVAYFKEVFTDGEDENNVEATAGLAKIYYNQKNFAKSVFYYNKIVEKFPNNPIGHGGLLSNYIEMWKGDQNPQFVLNHHRQVRNAIGIEGDLSLFVLAKLASFYIDLNASEVRIKYNINPEDQVTNMDLEDNVQHLLDKAFFKTEKGEDGEDVKGDEFAEGYYQRGRFLINKGESIQALKQFEFAASYDPAHYLAVMEMGEHYMRVNNYSESIDLLENAKKRYLAYRDYYGNREEDETLLNGDPGRIFFDEGKIVFMESSLISKDGKISEFPDRKVYPDKSLSQLSEEESNRRKNLNNAMQKFDLALRLNLKDPKLKRELYYYKGWIEYMRSDFEAALNEWSNLSEDDTYLNSNVMIGRANAFYNLEQLNASLGNYIKIKEDFEDKESAIARPTPEESAHQEIYNVLIAVYNNIGAVYERKGNSAQALKHYWKAIEVARKIGLTTEIANYNKDMVFKAKPGSALPLLDDWLSPTIDTVKELQNTKKGRL